MRTLFLIAPFLLLLGCPASVDPDDLDDEEVDDPSWETDVQPILAAYCGSCHEGAAGGSGGIGWLNSHDDVTTVADAGVCEGSTRAECIPVRILDGSMPAFGECLPGDQDCITEAQFATVQNWVDAGFPE